MSRRKYKFKIQNSKEFKNKLLFWTKTNNPVLYLNSNNYKNKRQYKTKYELLVAVGKKDEIILTNETNVFAKFEKFSKTKNDWLFGYFSYDLKNDIENLSSKNMDNLKFPELHFFVPEYVFKLQNDILEIDCFCGEYSAKKILSEIFSTQFSLTQNQKIKEFIPVINKNDFLKKIMQIKYHIQKGDIYETNFCQEFYSSETDIIPENLYHKLNNLSPVPFSAFYKNLQNYLISASPERFVKKESDIIVSQPIKGTIKRGKNQKEDTELKQKLKNDIKEQTENVMIVDLVRNDLSKIATKSSIKVNELFGIYTFPQVHQMISTIEAKSEKDISNIEIIKNLFPPGSMTGAPKIRAMQIIEQYEESKRGIYSGTVGYFAPNGDFDFNVVIRSLMYNANAKYLSFQVGGAITAKSFAENEYQECLLKAKAMIDVCKDHKKENEYY